MSTLEDLKSLDAAFEASKTADMRENMNLPSYVMMHAIVNLLDKTGWLSQFGYVHESDIQVETREEEPTHNEGYD